MPTRSTPATRCWCHVATLFDATDEERAELMAAIDITRRAVEAEHEPGGYIGINVGEAGGQTVGHLHVHVTPRYAGDVPDPRGGVWLVPDKAAYWEGRDPGGGQW